MEQIERLTRRGDGWLSDTGKVIAATVGIVALLSIGSRVLGVEVLGGAAIQARIAATERVNARQDTTLSKVQSEIGAVLQMTCRQTRRTDPEWLPAECDRVLSRTR